MLARCGSSVRYTSAGYDDGISISTYESCGCRLGGFFFFHWDRHWIWLSCYSKQSTRLLGIARLLLPAFALIFRVYLIEVA